MRWIERFYLWLTGQIKCPNCGNYYDPDDYRCDCYWEERNAN